MITASRLAKEKHVDWIAKAVLKAKKEIPKLTFDIYGQGGEKDKIEQIVYENNAQEYITLKGHVNLQDVYSKYELFVSASQSEGFGLTLMEAVGSGLGMIGFNVNYGNPTFIRNGENGYLMSENVESADEEEKINELASYIVKYFKNGPKNPERTSYEIASEFLTQKIVEKWDMLIKEVLHD